MRIPKKLASQWARLTVDQNAATWQFGDWTGTVAVSPDSTNIQTAVWIGGEITGLRIPAGLCWTQNSGHEVTVSGNGLSLRFPVDGDAISLVPVPSPPPTGLYRTADGRLVDASADTSLILRDESVDSSLPEPPKGVQRWVDRLAEFRVPAGTLDVRKLRSIHRILLLALPGARHRGERQIVLHPEGTVTHQSPDFEFRDQLGWWKQSSSQCRLDINLMIKLFPKKTRAITVLCVDEVFVAWRDDVARQSVLLAGIRPAI